MADTYDLLSLAEGKRAIGQETNVDPGFVTELEAAITSVSQRLVDICGAVVSRTYTSEKYDGGDYYLTLRNAGVGELVTTTISSVTEYDTGGTSTALSEEDYDTKPANGYLYEADTATLYRRSSGADVCFAAGRRNVLVTYTSSRAATTAAVPAKFKQAAGIMLAHLWRQRGPQAGAFRTDVEGPMFGVAPFALPRAVLDILRHEIKPDKLYGIG